MDDSELVAEARRGDHEAFATLVTRHRRSAEKTAALVAGTSDIQDVVQEALVKAFTTLDQLREAEAFRGWLLAIVANEARVYVRSAVRRRAAQGRAAHILGSAPSAESLAIDAEQSRVLLAAISELRHVDRQVLELRYLSGLSERETADVLDCPAGTVKSRLSRAIERLRANPLLEALVETLPERKGIAVELERTKFDVALEHAWEELGRGHLDPVGKVLGDKSGWWIGGRSALAGEYKGREQVLGYFRRLIERSDGTYKTSGVDVSSTDYHSFLCYLSTATVDGQTLSWHETVVMHRDGEVLGDCFVYFYDQYEFDQFWSSSQAAS